MTGADSVFEERLLTEVTGVLRRTERVPAAVLAAARDAYRWRRVASAIAELEFDSAVDDDDLARVRDGGSERRLRFRVADRVAEVAVIDGGRRMVGRVDPPFGGSMVLRSPSGSTVNVEIDDLGRFIVEPLPRGAISLRHVPSDTAMADFETEWVTI